MRLASSLREIEISTSSLRELNLGLDIVINETLIFGIFGVGRCNLGATRLNLAARDEDDEGD